MVVAQKRIAEELNQIRATTLAKHYEPFTKITSVASLSADSVFTEGATVYRFNLNPATANLIENEPAQLLTLTVPLTSSQTMELELIPQTIFSPSFSLTNAKGEKVPPMSLGAHYRGIIKGDEQSVAAISIIDGEISGIISNKAGNYNLGKERNTPNYIFYNDKDLKKKLDFTCGTTELPTRAMGQNLIKNTSSLTNVACGSVEIYFEVDNALYQNLGSSIPNSLSYVASLFNNVATLYSNEGLSAVISEIKVWDTTDPYVENASTSAALTDFRTTVGTNFNGRLAHLLSGRSLGGGIAYIDVLCEKSYAHGVSASLSTTITNIPTYSWNVEVVTHELGHNFGSPHTQSCTWPGGAIDNCYTTEGGCAPGPAPVNGGTIMSYCHLTNYGINFANGFGTLPGNLIRNLTQACLGSAAAPTNLTTLELYDTQALISWTHDSGTYTVEYKPASSSTWISAGTTSGKNKFLTSLTANTAYDWRVKVNCSEYAVGTFTTNSTTAPPLYCTTSHTNSCSYGIAITGVQMGGTTLSSASGCVSGGYNFLTSPVKDLSLGQNVNFTITLDGYYNDSQLAIWIDLNGDHQFQSGEKIYTTTTAITQALSGSFTVPANSTLGKTRMRIILNFSSAPTNPCGTYSYGETEDYYVNLTCASVTQYTVTGGGSYCTGGTGVAVGLSGSQTGVNYQLKRGGSAVGSPVAGTGSAINFGLQTIAGNYTVEANSVSCSASPMTGSVNVSVTLLPTLSAGTVTDPSTCGGSNGSIAFTTTNLTDGSYTLTYTGSGSPKTVTVTSNAFTLSGLTAGTYSNFSITNNGCTGTDATSKTLSNPPSPTLAAGAITNPTTCSSTNGSIAFTSTNLANGNYTLTYTGSGSPKTVTITSNVFTLTGLAAGTYSNFSITNNGCTGTDPTSKTLTNPPTPILTAGTVTHPTCSSTNGSIAFTTANLSNGNYTLTYTGSGSPKTITVTSNAFTLTNLAAGTYSNFSITNNGCTGTDPTSKTLTAPLTPTLTAGTATNPTTCSGTNGSIAFTSTNLANGTYSLTFTGSGSPKNVTVTANAFSLTGLAAGTYSNFSITNNGCTGTEPTSKTLANPPTPTLTAGTVTHPTTCGGTNGSIAFTTTNLGNGDYSLTFTGNGSPKTVTVTNNSFILNGLGVGSYSNFTIVNNGCTGTDPTSKTLTNPTSPVLTAGAVANPTTCGGNNGSIAFTTANLTNGNYTLTFSGTDSPKTITISNNAFSLTGLAAGTYSNFSITNNGCTGTEPTSKTLTNPLTPSLTAGTVTNPTTCGGTNGSIAFTTANLTDGNYTLTFTGSGSPRTVSIASNTFTLTNLAAGTYSNFSITNNGCIGTDATAKILSNPASPNAGVISGPLNLCTGATVTFTSNGVSGGSWSSNNTSVATINPTTGLATGMAAGSSILTYTVTTNGCSAAATATLTVDSVSVGGNVSGSTAVCSGVNNTALTLTGLTGSVQKWQSAVSADFTSPSDIPNTASVLTVNNLTQTMYYRAVVKSGVCSPANSSGATVLVNPLPIVSITGQDTIAVDSTTQLSPTTGGSWVSNAPGKATVTNAGAVKGVGIGSVTFTFTQTSTGCSNTTGPVLVISNGNPCFEAIALVSPTDDYNGGIVLKQTNVTINASNKITGASTTVTYQAGSSVTLSPGFQAEAGTVFKTQIAGCN
ncbi:MAG: GEVED domain-containing protein [Spirosomataceae bacterium]